MSLDFELKMFDNYCHTRLNTGGERIATMNVSLPDQMKDWVEAQVESGRYANVNDYVRDFIHRDQSNREELEYLAVFQSDAIEKIS